MHWKQKIAKISLPFPVFTWIAAKPAEELFQNACLSSDNVEILFIKRIPTESHLTKRDFSSVKVTQKVSYSKDFYVKSSYNAKENPPVIEPRKDLQKRLLQIFFFIIAFISPKGIRKSFFIWHWSHDHRSESFFSGKN